MLTAQTRHVQHKSLPLGVIIGVLAALGAAIFIALGKAIGASTPPIIMVFIQNLVSLILIIPFIVIKHKHAFLKHHTFSNVKTHHLLRAILSVLSILCMYEGMKLGLSSFDATVLYFLFPLFIPIVAVFTLRAKVPLLVWPFMLLGFIGVACCLHFDKNIISWPALLGVLSAIFAAIHITLITKVTSLDGGFKTVYHFF